MSCRRVPIRALPPRGVLLFCAPPRPMAPPKFLAVCCRACHQHQVQPVRKAGVKFTCRNCNTTQVPSRVYAKAEKAAQCREVVQALNAAKGRALDDAQAHQEREEDGQEDDAGVAEALASAVVPAPDWGAYMSAAAQEDDGDALAAAATRRDGAGDARWRQQPAQPTQHARLGRFGGRGVRSGVAASASIVRGGSVYGGGGGGRGWKRRAPDSGGDDDSKHSAPSWKAHASKRPAPASAPSPWASYADAQATAASTEPTPLAARLVNAPPPWAAAKPAERAPPQRDAQSTAGPSPWSSFLGNTGHDRTTTNDAAAVLDDFWGAYRNSASTGREKSAWL